MPAINYSLDQLVAETSKAYHEAKNKIGKCNVLIIGKTGVGKSTLVNAIFGDKLAQTGVGLPVTQSIEQYKKENYAIAVYDTPGLEIYEGVNQNIKKEVARLIDKKRNHPPTEHIHIVWYCINQQANRLESFEADWIKEITMKGVPIILVLTKAISGGDSDFIFYLKSLNLPVSDIIQVLAAPMILSGNITVPESGIENLIESTANLVSEVARKAFISEQIKDFDLKLITALSYVDSYTLSGEIGLIESLAEIMATTTVIFGLSFQEYQKIFNAVINAVELIDEISEDKIIYPTIALRIIKLTGRVVIENLMEVLQSRINDHFLYKLSKNIIDKLKNYREIKGE